MYSSLHLGSVHHEPPSLSSRVREEAYPDVCVQTAGVPAGNNEAEGVPENHFLPVEENVWKKGLNAFRDQGLYAALEHFAGAEDGGLCQKAARTILSLCQWVWMLPNTWYPHLQLPIDDATDVFSKTPRWRTAAVRAIAWHHSCKHLAVARHDGIIEIHHFGMQAGTHTTLTDHRQRNITDMQWAPHLHNILAVVTQEGLLVWYFDIDSVSHSRLTPTWTRLETSPAHRPITSLSWCPDELSVVTCSPCDTAMKLWDIPLATHTNIVRHKGGGVTMVKWSHDGARVFAATPTPMFRVWDTSQWTCEQWTNLASPCTAAAWSPTGETLLFALRNDPALYCVTFPPEGCATPSNAVRCVDISAAISVHTEQEIVLGTVKDMVWDPSGETIATIFEDYRAVAIFQVRLSPVVEVVFGHLIPGRTGQPLAIAFQPSDTAAVPVLSIAWSNGRVSTHFLA